MVSQCSNYRKIYKKKATNFLYKPKLILEGNYHYNNRSILPLYLENLETSPDYEFINENIDISLIPEKNDF